MLKFEWALICPDNPDVKRVQDNVFDIDEYVVDVAKKEGLPARPHRPCPKASPCIWPAMPAPRIWAPRRRKC